MRIRILISIVCVLMLWPAVSSAYSQKYYQSYYQAYYQTYYQGYYQAGYYSQASYGLTFTTPVAALDDVLVTGSLAKGGGSFVIDHPLDPKNKLLYHSFVESPDVKNLYDGVVRLDAKGEAIVTLPAYFEALNKDFRYQVKPLGAAMPNLHIKQEVVNNVFVIGGGLAQGEVSWQVTGTRHDPYILANPVIVEVQKSDEADISRGRYVFSEGYANRLPLQGFFSGVWNALVSLF